jgi:hypothetical protein
MPDLPTLSRANPTFINRSNQRTIDPTGVKGRSMADVIWGSAIGLASTTMNNGDQIVVNYTLTQNSEYELIAENFVTVYIGSVASANILPGGSGIDESQWQMIGPFQSFARWASENYPRHQSMNTLYLRNISAGAQTILLYNRWRYFCPRET